MSIPVTRFAPSPTGLLHAGHAFSALCVERWARQHRARILLRIEDIDHTRCREAFRDALLEDLAWLGLEWEEPVRRQSEHLADYRERLESLSARGLIYPCFCTRREILAEVERAGGAPHGPEGVLYPGTCRRLSTDERETRLAAGEAHALRLDLAAALRAVGERPLIWRDSEAGDQTAEPGLLGDVVLARKDIGTSYHLSVVVDDALQGVTQIVRGVDLFESTHLHCLLQAVFGFARPDYLHHELIRDKEGDRLAKRRGSETLRALRERGVTAAQLRETLGFRESL